MIVEEIVGHIDDIKDELLKSRHVEKVYLESADLVKRVQRVVTDHGKEIGIRIKQHKDLTAGDILYMDEQDIVVIDVVADDLLIISPKSLRQMGDIAHQIGNRHIPAQFEEDAMFVQYDYLLEDLLKSSGVPYIREEKKVKNAFRHIGHSHG